MLAIEASARLCMTHREWRGHIKGAAYIISRHNGHRTATISSL
jgi:hypothetical protein